MEDTSEILPETEIPVEVIELRKLIKDNNGLL